MENATVNDIPVETQNIQKSYSEILNKISESAKNLVQNDLILIMTELKKIRNDIGIESRKIAIFGLLLAISTIPFLAFAIIVLGQALDNRYWLSSLILGIVFSIVGTTGVWIAIRKLKRINVDLSNTKAALKKEGEMICKQFNKITLTVRGDGHAIS